MANLTYDVRRTDLRTNVFATPYWITSGEITGAMVGTVGLFAFGVADQIIWVHNVVCQIITVFDAGTIDVGLGSLATEAKTAGDELTTTDADEYIKNAEITATTLGYYGSTAGAGKSDWQVAQAAFTYAAPNIIAAAAATTPLVFATVAGSTSGAARVHMLISRIPGK
jgi:hypothetical protein